MSPEVEDLSRESYHFNAPSADDSDDIVRLFVESREAGNNYPHPSIPLEEKSIVRWLASGPVSERIVVKHLDQILAYAELEDLSVYTHGDNLRDLPFSSDEIQFRRNYWKAAFKDFQEDPFERITVFKRFVVATSHQRIGLGEKMLDFSCEKIWSEGRMPGAVVLKDLDPAINLYRKKGVELGDFPEPSLKDGQLSGVGLLSFVFPSP